jgi:hypothetical protein
MRSFLLFASLVGLVLSDEACYNHVTVRRMSPGDLVSSLHRRSLGSFSKSSGQQVVTSSSQSMLYLSSLPVVMSSGSNRGLSTGSIGQQLF